MSIGRTFDYIRGGIYIFIAIVSIFRLIIIYRMENRRAGYKKQVPLILQKVFHFLVLTIATIRIIYTYLPVSTWTAIRDPFPGALYFIDVLPETLFLYLYFLFALAWIEILMKSRLIENEYFSTPTKFWRVYLTLCISIELVIIISAIIIQFTASAPVLNYLTKWEVLFNIVLATIVCIASLLMTFILIKFYKRVIDSNLLNNIMIQMFTILIITAFGVFFKPIYNFIMRLVFTIDKIPFEMIFCYYILLEIVPLILILIILYNVLNHKSCNCCCTYTRLREIDEFDDVNSFQQKENEIL